MTDVKVFESFDRRILSDKFVVFHRLDYIHVFVFTGFVSVIKNLSKTEEILANEGVC
jgi:hypothetical protein